MTTLDWLFRKNLVSRRMCDRAYAYWPRGTYRLRAPSGQQNALLIKELEKRCDRRRPGDSTAVPIAKSDERQQARTSAELVDLSSQNESLKKNRT